MSKRTKTKTKTSGNPTFHLLHSAMLHVHDEAARRSDQSSAAAMMLRRGPARDMEKHKNAVLVYGTASCVLYSVVNVLKKLADEEFKRTGQ